MGRMCSIKDSRLQVWQPVTWAKKKEWRKRVGSDGEWKKVNPCERIIEKLFHLQMLSTFYPLCLSLWGWKSSSFFHVVYMWMLDGDERRGVKGWWCLFSPLDAFPLLSFSFPSLRILFFFVANDNQFLSCECDERDFVYVSEKSLTHSLFSPKKNPLSHLFPNVCFISGGHSLSLSLLYQQPFSSPSDANGGIFFNLQLQEEEKGTATLFLPLPFASYWWAHLSVFSVNVSKKRREENEGVIREQWEVSVVVQANI